MENNENLDNDTLISTEEIYTYSNYFKLDSLKKMDSTIKSLNEFMSEISQLNNKLPDNLSAC